MRFSPVHLEVEVGGDGDADVRLALTTFLEAQAAQSKIEAIAAKSRVDSMRAANKEYADAVRNDDSIGVGFGASAPYSNGEILRAEDAANRSTENNRQIAMVRDYVLRHVCGWRSEADK